MKTKEEILKPYIEVPFRHTQVVEKDNALKAMDEYASQFQQDRTFWGRLESFVSNVQVNDAMSEEEKEYILNVAKQLNPKQS